MLRLDYHQQHYNDCIYDNFENACFDKKWISVLHEDKKINKYVCFVCKQVANKVMRSTENEKALIVGRKCLKKYKNDTSMHDPNQSRHNYPYDIDASMQVQVENLHVVCWQQYQLDVQYTKTLEKREGKYLPMLNTAVCTFRGKLKCMKEHLEQSCQLTKWRFYIKSVELNASQQKIEQLEKRVVKLENENKQLKLQAESNTKNEIHSFKEKTSAKPPTELSIESDQYELGFICILSCKKKKNNLFAKITPFFLFSAKINIVSKMHIKTKIDPN
ncbi:hypothetical protein RFI_01249 [Reticulomyxa filosa]|uniref:TRAF-type domain-containing protein n=1 Tax=Reticulomyxa filosa TaxID=46433 RepID=X6PB84_RETFI|nr:hypothetical protein RFI_01249 [Reticulomyxa filosa]|eukprot:ETO35815.1 hypothetical protein RFI_01249 [Reticulomyxa filosa]